MKPARPIVLAAGGTGGHMFPAEALAKALAGRGHRPVLVTDRRGGTFSDGREDVTVYRIRAAGSGGRGLVGKLRMVSELAVGTVQAMAVLRHLDPLAVVGFGGYASAPTVYAAARRGTPVVLHEQNAVLGRANRMLARRAARIATSFDSVAMVAPEDRAKLVRTGNPVRPAIAERRGVPYPALDGDAPLGLVVLGGSQGAKVFPEVVPQALAKLPEGLRRRIRLSLQARPEDLAAAQAAVAALGLAGAEVSSFFTDVPDRLAGAHLAITRSGASTVAELTAIGRPSILVPYPSAMDDHQTANAQAVADAGAAWLMQQPSFTAEALAERLQSLFALPASLTHAAARAQDWGTVRAAEALADVVIDLLPRSNGHHPDYKEAAE
ncbi:MAG TPA: undecaprenyldiphospho-muramoylpentapeptide beta-N-acetylglucosaminyltransferase [Alphaproteobacteria bacterium]|nr:undecaprenyldiphospho-muramoylpentapeptide beta-N-acetylglucosaminyltransferase [Alphaproteobacteria bacterium]